jgi:hypothetical protein
MSALKKSLLHAYKVLIHLMLVYYQRSHLIPRDLVVVGVTTNKIYINIIFYFIFVMDI